MIQKLKGSEVSAAIVAALVYLKNNPQDIKHEPGSTEGIRNSTEKLVLNALLQQLRKISYDVVCLIDAGEVKEWKELWLNNKDTFASRGAILVVHDPNSCQGSPDFWVVYGQTCVSLNVKSSKEGIVMWNSGLPSPNDVCVIARTAGKSRQKKKTMPNGMTYTMGCKIYSQEEIQKMRASRQKVRDTMDYVQMNHDIGNGLIATSSEYYRPMRIDNRNWLIPPLSNNNFMREKEVEEYLRNFNWGIPISLAASVSVNMENKLQKNALK